MKPIQPITSKRNCNYLTSFSQTHIISTDSTTKFRRFSFLLGNTFTLQHPMNTIFLKRVEWLFLKGNWMKNVRFFEYKLPIDPVCIIKIIFWYKFRSDG